MTREEAILYLEHTGSDDFNLEEHQIQNRLNAIQFLLEENQELKENYERIYNENCILREEHNINDIDLLDKNQELKQQLHEASLTIQEMTEQDIECPSNCEKLRQLKKQLEDKTEDYKRMKDNFDSKVDVITEIDTQQKEFIKYLEDEIYSIEPKGTDINYDCEYYSEEDYVNAMKEQSRLNTLKEILQRYKSIIGDDK